MNSLQTELEKIAAKIDFPDKELDETKTKVPMAEQVFIYYKAHPLSTVAEAVKFFPDAREGFVASTTFALFRRGFLDRQNTNQGFRYSTKFDKYPRYSKEMRSAKMAGKQNAKRKPALTTNKAEESKSVAPAIKASVPKLTAESILDVMPTREAYKLYKELHTMFGWQT